MIMGKGKVDLETVTSWYFGNDDKKHSEVEENIKYLGVIKRTGEIGEYGAAVMFWSHSEELFDIDMKKFDEFCDRLFNENYTPELAAAIDIFNIQNELSDERHYVFSKMISKRGEELKEHVNRVYACVRGMRYERICNELDLVGKKINAVDLGCAEGRLEEHYNKTRNGENVSFHASDRSSYILIHAKRRNRHHSNIKFYKGDLKTSDLNPLFEFSEKRYTVAIMSEFLEHMKKEDAFSLMDTVLGEYAPDKMIITTPNGMYTALYKKTDPNNMIHVFEYSKKDLEVELSRLVEKHTDYWVSKLEGVGGSDTLPQSFFVCVEKKA